MYKIIKQNFLKQNSVKQSNISIFLRNFSSIPCVGCATNIQCVELAHCKSKSKSESNDSCNSIGEIGVGFNPSGSFNIGIQSGIPCVNILNFNDISPKKNINNNANNYVNDLNNDDDDDV